MPINYRRDYPITVTHSGRIVVFLLPEIAIIAHEHGWQPRGENTGLAVSLQAVFPKLPIERAHGWYADNLYVKATKEQEAQFFKFYPELKRYYFNTVKTCR